MNLTTEVFTEINFQVGQRTHHHGRTPATTGVDLHLNLNLDPHNLTPSRLNPSLAGAEPHRSLNLHIPSLIRSQRTSLTNTWLHGPSSSSHTHIHNILNFRNLSPGRLHLLTLALQRKHSVGTIYIVSDMLSLCRVLSQCKYIVQKTCRSNVDKK